MSDTRLRSQAVKKYLSPAQVASLPPGLTDRALAIRRHQHLDPVFCRFEQTAVTPLADLDAWITALRISAARHGR